MKASQGSREGREAEAKLGEGPRAGLGASREPPRTASPPFVPGPVKFFKSSKQQEGQWSSLYRVISSVSGEDQSSESCSSKGEGKRKKMGGEGKKKKKKLPGPISAG